MNEPNKLKKFIDLIKKFEKDLSFKIAEIGAHPYGDPKENFHQLLDYFPNSKIYAFEVDEEECKKLNTTCKKGIEFFPFALGEKKEKRKFYQTYHPVCSSLYEPNEKLIRNYNNLNIAYLKEITEIETISLDEFLKLNKIDDLDFIKIDIQGAELDVFKGANKILDKVLMIVSEVEFVHQYINQPLFGDVSSFLDGKEFMFHKFLGFGGRTLKPVIMGNNENFATQQFWSDAIFIKKINDVSKMESLNLLKASILSFIYGSPDLTFFYLTAYDKKNKTDISNLYQKIY
ncbi:FkbM family methyltransferase [Candidatus Pelagibacter communis]|uniref:FkbM family methyltransferase n=1 Tax=Pelagibacter ubique TaxID=198252 RepID=UPI00094DC2C9|nr:FkbM family methyltransferase [Candidatus Pelagibacter ubique]